MSQYISNSLLAKVMLKVQEKLNFAGSITRNEFNQIMHDTISDHGSFAKR